MDKLIAAFPNNLSEAIQIAKQSKLSNPSKPINHVVVLGMGGSGIGGELMTDWTQDYIRVPMKCFHSYTIPNFVSENTLVIASSYSGNTEETLMALNKANQKNAKIVGICSGGKLEAFCKANQYDCIVVPGGNPPRTALAFSLVQLAHILNTFGLVDELILNQLLSAKNVLEREKDTIQQKAKDLAAFIKGTVPVFYATTPYQAALVRAKQQFNENSKMLCWTHVIPEMNHNELVGWGGGDERFSAIYFDTQDLIPRNEKRAAITLDVVAQKTKLLKLQINGDNFIERSLYLIHLVDWASFYLSELKQVDAFEIDIIYHLKSELENFKG